MIDCTYICIVMCMYIFCGKSTQESISKAVLLRLSSMTHSVSECNTP